MVFNATFYNISVISGIQFYWWMKPEYPKKTTDLSLTNLITYCYIEHTCLNRVRHNHRDPIPQDIITNNMLIYFSTFIQSHIISSFFI